MTYAEFPGNVDTLGSTVLELITDNARLATAVPLKDARKWMREAKTLARFDGDVIEKGEYILDGKPTTLTAADLINSK